MHYATGFLVAVPLIISTGLYLDYQAFVKIKDLIWQKLPTVKRQAFDPGYYKTLMDNA